MASRRGGAGGRPRGARTRARQEAVSGAAALGAPDPPSDPVSEDVPTQERGGPGAGRLKPGESSRTDTSVSQVTGPPGILTTEVGVVRAVVPEMPLPCRKTRERLSEESPRGPGRGRRAHAGVSSLTTRREAAPTPSLALGAGRRGVPRETESEAG